MARSILTDAFSPRHYTTAAPTAPSTTQQTPPPPKPGFPYETSRDPDYSPAQLAEIRSDPIVVAALAAAEKARNARRSSGR